MSEERVTVERDGSVAHVQMSRPDKRNGLDLAMFEALVETGRSLARDPTVRAVVLSGQGKAFCAGLDVKSFAADPAVGRRLLDRSDESPANLAQRAAWIWQEVPVPVIAAIHGQAFGGGLQIALGADLRYATPDAELSVMEIRWGLIPDMSASKTLSTLVGLDVAKELTWTGRRVRGDEAATLGLVTRVCDDPIGAALETARAIATRSPHAIRAAKRLWNEAPTKDVRAAFALETELQLTLLGSESQLEAIRANLTNTAPSFRDPTG